MPSNRSRYPTTYIERQVNLKLSTSLFNDIEYTRRHHNLDLNQLVLISLSHFIKCEAVGKVFKRLDDNDEEKTLPYKFVY